MPWALKGFKLGCPQCGAKEAITLDLNDLALITCNECNESFTVETALRLALENLRRWKAVAKWIALAGESLADTSSTE
jgi:transposase-like protein